MEYCYSVILNIFSRKRIFLCESEEIFNIYKRVIMNQWRADILYDKNNLYLCKKCKNEYVYNNLSTKVPIGSLQKNFFFFSFLNV